MGLGHSEGTFKDADLGAWSYSLAWTLVGGVARVVAVSLRSLDIPPREVTPRVLQAVKDHDRQRRDRAVRGIAEAGEQPRRKRRADEGSLVHPSLETVRRAAAQADLYAPGRSRGGRRPLDAELLTRVSLVYRGGGSRPRQAVAKAFGISEDLASKYIRRARQTLDTATGKPFLGPTTPGKVGDQEGGQ